MTRSLLLPLLVTTAMATSGAARADEVMPPPQNCPPGAQGESSHQGEWCQPHRCTGEAQCRPGQVCREAGLCVQVTTQTRGERWGGGEYTEERVMGTGTCDACAAPATCLTAKYCFASDAIPARPGPTKAQPQQPPTPMDRVIVRGVDEDDDGCSTTATRSFGGLALGILFVAAAFLAKRRTR
jgi:hypothetical protein